MEVLYVFLAFAIGGTILSVALWTLIWLKPRFKSIQNRFAWIPRRLSESNNGFMKIDVRRVGDLNDVLTERDRYWKYCVAYWVYVIFLVVSSIGFVIWGFNLSFYFCLCGIVFFLFTNTIHYHSQNGSFSYFTNLITFFERKTETNNYLIVEKFLCLWGYALYRLSYQKNGKNQIPEIPQEIDLLREYAVHVLYEEEEE